MNKRWQGILLAIQFFSVLPIRREIPMNTTQLRGAILFLPWLGSLLGSLTLLISYLLVNYTTMSMAGVAAISLVTMIVWTGGIHLDGWMDTSDAFFSYQPTADRLKIMDDPRTGAFGVISVIVLLVLRFIFMMEVLNLSFFYFVIGIIGIPFVARMKILAHFVWTPLAKREGLSFLFSRSMQANHIITSFVCMMIIGIVLTSIWSSLLLPIILLFGCSIAMFFLGRYVIRQSFGGITGDVLGAVVEGGEAVLWIVLWICTLFVIV
ncbi:adenosylcobinamide-GDP ribazoletransferase [Pontibacillus salicampi]|uniref:Adenosylcobinamide-GDP ribazoletransferase n=1 Tax=Pontibacillus salicampi TaxID=1449801 RepID=A0ABV6LK95_9BACI